MEENELGSVIQNGKEIILVEDQLVSLETELLVGNGEHLENGETLLVLGDDCSETGEVVFLFEERDYVLHELILSLGIRGKLLQQEDESFSWALELFHLLTIKFIRPVAILAGRAQRASL